MSCKEVCSLEDSLVWGFFKCRTRRLKGICDELREKVKGSGGVTELRSEMLKVCSDLTQAWSKRERGEKAGAEL